MVAVEVEGIVVIGAYCSPAVSVGEFAERIAEGLGSAGGEQEVVMCGDFNCRWDKRGSTRMRELEGCLEEAGLWVCNDTKCPTYFDGKGGSSAIDLFTTNLREEEVKFQGYLMGKAITSLRKHVPVVLHIKRSVGAMEAGGGGERVGGGLMRGKWKGRSVGGTGRKWRHGTLRRTGGD